MNSYWDGDVLYYDYSLEDVRKIGDKDAIKVGEAWIYDAGRKRNCGLIFYLLGQEKKTRCEQAIERAKIESKKLVQELRQGEPQWGKVAHVQWDGTKIEWFSQ